MFMGNYVISGKNQYQERERLKRILSDSGTDRGNLIDLDASDAKNFRIDAALLECNVISLFAEDSGRTVILRNPWFLKAADRQSSSEKTAASRDRLLDVLEQYLQHPNPACTLIFFLDGCEADTRRKEYKLLEKYHTEKIVCNPVRPWDFPAHISELLKQGGFILDPEARREFDLRVGTDEFQLHQAIEKLSLYGEKRYDAAVIRQLIPEDTGLDMWKLGNAFLSGNTAEVMRSHSRMKAKGMDAMAMIPLLSSQLRRAYDVRALADLGYDQSVIAVRLRMKETAVKMNLRNLQKLRARSILRRMSDLAAVEQGIKAGRLDAERAFETYLLRWSVNHG